MDCERILRIIKRNNINIVAGFADSVTVTSGRERRFLPVVLHSHLMSLKSLLIIQKIIICINFIDLSA